MRRLIPGQQVQWQDRLWEIVDLEGLDRVHLRIPEKKATKVAPVTDLLPVHASAPEIALGEVKDSAWAKAIDILEAIRPLIEKPAYQRTADEVDAAAKSLKKSHSSIYAYLKLWETHQRASVFLRKTRSDKGKATLPDAVHEIIARHLKAFFKKEERPTMAEVTEQVRCDCDEAGLPRPCYKTVVKAIQKLQPREVAEGRYGKKLAREKFEPIRGPFPGADFPLAVVQIDHTPADVILVDEQERREIKRPFLTLVIDVCTRMVCGFYVTFEHPGALSCALALSNAILPKDEWLREHGLDAPWPIWGIPRKVHADNAKEFRGTALTRGCGEHNIILENRPKGLPQYGGHIERSFRTFMKATQRLKGTTFSNVVEKVNYDSQGKAVMTLKEYERWFAIYLGYRYHNKKHRGTGYPPIKLYEKHILGDATKPGIGQPLPIPDKRRLFLDFLPFTTRVVSREGIVWDDIKYWNDSLRRWVGSRDPENPKNPRKFICARDPRDISFIYFFDPERKDYIAIPYRDRSGPPMSLWELERIKSELADDPRRKTDEAMVFRGIRLMREVESQADQTTKETRLKKSRQNGWSQSKKTLRSTRNSGGEETDPPVSPQEDATPMDDIIEFDVDESTD